MAEKRLIIIDANSIIHRAFHALPPLMTKKGELVNAVYGFLLVLLRIIKEFHPDFIVACFDTAAPTFRHIQFKEYKAKRPPVPEDLKKQMSKVKEALDCFNITIYVKEGFEADDLIGTIGKKFSQKHSDLSEVIILSGDSDMLQLVGKKIKVCLLKTGVKELVLYSEEKVRERYRGLSPNQIVDFKALKGDPSDNIPGVAGVGEKTAIELLLQFGDISHLYDAIEKDASEAEVLRPKLKELLLRNKEKAFLSRDLAEIKIDVPTDMVLADLAWKEYDKKALTEFFQTMEFHSLIGRIFESDEKQSKQSKLGI